MRLRRPTVADSPRMAAALVDGFATYRSFAPEGWDPPGIAHEEARLNELLVDDDVWSLIAEAGELLAGQATMLSAVNSPHPADDPRLGHLRNLFVAERFWGTGLATELHKAAVDAGRERGFTRMRLFTPARHARARRFYEREGWYPYADEFDEPKLGLTLIEYQRELLLRRAREPIQNKTFGMMSGWSSQPRFRSQEVPRRSTSSTSRA